MGIFEAIFPSKTAEPQAPGVAFVRLSKSKVSKDDEVDTMAHADKQAFFLKLYESVPIVHQIIDVQVDQAVQEFHFEGPNSESLSEFAEDHNLQSWMYRMAKNLLIFGNAYCEVVKLGEEINKLKILNPVWMQTYRKATGEVIGFSQIIDNQPVVLWGSTGDEQTDSRFPRKITDISTIVHFKYNVLASDKYGRSAIECIAASVKNKIYMESNLGPLLNKYVAPLIWAKVGSNEMPASSEHVTTIANTLKNLHAESEISTTHLVDLKVMDFNSKGMDLSTPIKTIDQNIITGGGVPPILLGMNEGAVDKASEVQLRSFTRHIKAIQRELKEEFEDKIIVAQGLGSSEDEFYWSGVEEREWELETDILRGLVKDGVITAQKANSLLPPKYQEELPDMSEMPTPRASQASSDKLKDNPTDPTKSTKLKNADGKRNIKTERELPE